MKEDIIAILHQKISEKMSEAELAIKNVQDAANNDSKSSMGDKYETSREMAQQDLSMLCRQYEAAREDLQTLGMVNLHDNEKVSKGSFVSTTIGEIFIAVNYGFLKINDKKVIVTAPNSPLGQSLMGKKIGQDFEVQGKKQKIITIS